MERDFKQARLLTKKSEYVMDYPTAIEYAETQQKIFWLPDEIGVEKDVQDLRVNMNDAEKHGVITTLKLFTLYELVAGNEYWGGRITRTFQRPDIQRMANCFSFFEINVHGPFYNKLNEVLGLDTEEFYSDYINDPILKGRMESINAIVSDKDILKSLLAFSMVEGAILYSSFAFLKHFQSQGKNMLNNVVSGINFSVSDENLHAEAGAWLFSTLLYELDISLDDYKQYALETATQIYEHEKQIISKIFEKGAIKGITEHQLEEFVKSRLNLCLRNLGFKDLYEVTYNPIASWFYKGINSVQIHDFFNRVGKEYNRSWIEGDFSW